MATDYRNVDVKWVAKVHTSKTSKLNIGGQVPSGMKRWVTFLMIDGAGVKTSNWGQPYKIFFASVGVSNPTAASIYAAANRKFMYDAVGSITKGSVIATGRHPGGRSLPPIRIPDRIDTNKPLFSITGGKWLAAFGSGSTFIVHAQYFDE